MDEPEIARQREDDLFDGWAQEQEDADHRDPDFYRVDFPEAA